MHFQFQGDTQQEEEANNTKRGLMSKVATEHKTRADNLKVTIFQFMIIRKWPELPFHILAAVYHFGYTFAAASF